jgi:hypothetical protein
MSQLSWSTVCNTKSFGGAVHPWIGGNQKVPLDILIYRLVRSYLRSSSMKRAALKALSKTLTEDELVYLRAQFMLLEPNKNGRVTFENFKTVGTLDFLYFLLLFFLRACSCYYACRIKVLLVLPSCFSKWVVQSQCQKFNRIGLLPLSKTLIRISCLQITKQPVSCYFDLLSRFIICLLVFG